jgi:hypothetical protein
MESNIHLTVFSNLMQCKFAKWAQINGVFCIIKNGIQFVFQNYVYGTLVFAERLIIRT